MVIHHQLLLQNIVVLYKHYASFCEVIDDAVAFPLVLACAELLVFTVKFFCLVLELLV
jgi:hypothetical protein